MQRGKYVGKINIVYIRVLLYLKNVKKTFENINILNYSNLSIFSCKIFDPRVIVMMMMMMMMMMCNDLMCT